MLSTTISKIKKVCSLVNITRGTRGTPSGRVGKFQKLAHIQIRGKSTDSDGKHPRTIIEFGFKGNKSDRKRQIDTFEKDLNIDDLQKCTFPRFANVMDKNYRAQKDCKMCEMIIRKIFRENPEASKQTTEASQLSHCKEINDPAAVNPQSANKPIKSENNDAQGFPAKLLHTIAQINMASNTPGDKDKQNKRCEPKYETVCKHDFMSDISKNSTLVNTTTENHSEDQIEQKVEKLEEPATVGDQEIGFNVATKPLQESASILNFAAEPERPPKQLTPQELKEISLDELAKRCVNFPDEELDEQLLKEMDKFTDCYSDQPNNTANDVQQCSKQTSYVPVNESHTDQPTYQNYTDPWYYMHNQFYQNHYYQHPFQQNPGYYNNQTEQTSYEQNAVNETPVKPINDADMKPDEPLKQPIISIENPSASTKQEEMEKTASQEEVRPQESLKQTVLTQNVIDVKSQVNENTGNTMDKLYPTCEHFVTSKDTNESVLQCKSALKPKSEPHVQCSNVFIDLYIAKDIERKENTNTEFKEEPIGLAKIFEFEQLDPNYVVTCNETCPISTDGLTEAKIKDKSLKGTEVIYDDKFKIPVENNIKLKTRDKSPEKRQCITELEGDAIITSRYPDQKLADAPRNCAKDIDAVSNLLQHGSAANIVSAQNIKINSEPQVPNDAETKSDLKDTQHTTLRLNDEEAPLSELLRRVRERHRKEHYNSFPLPQTTMITPEMRKCHKPPKKCPSECPKSGPTCPPPAPKCPPPAPKAPSPCPPEPACPKPCRPSPSPKKDPCKFQKCDDTCYSGGIILRNLRPLPLSVDGQVLDNSFIEKSCVKTIISDVILQKRETIYKWMLELLISQINGRFVRDYDPWTPIPSWPIPKKLVKRPLVCPKHGCKVFPPVRHTPPCTPQHKPCKGFPRRICSDSQLWDVIYL